MSWCNFTASKSERAYHCPASFALPEVPRKAGYPAQRGTFGHSYLEAGLRGSQEDADLFLFDKQARVPAWWIKDMEKIKIEDVKVKINSLYNYDSECLMIEAAFGYYEGITSFLGQNIGRNYPKGLDFTGSSDVYRNEFDNGYKRPVSIVDFKFGSKEVDAECLQLRNLACLAESTGCANGAVVAIAQFDKQNDMSLPEELPSKKYTSHELQLARQDLDATISNIKESRRLVTLGETPQVNPGDWCKWCDCTGCPNYEGK